MLEEQIDGAWQKLSRRTTDQDGRIQQLLPANESLHATAYRIVFETAGYYAAQQLQGLYPSIEITFIVSDPGSHYHIPLLLTANGYTTYRGS